MRSNYWIVAGLVLLMLIVIPACESSGDQEHSAKVVEAVNKVDAHSRPKDGWQPAEVDMTIFGGGRVRTGAASSAQLELLEGIVRIAAQSVFTVKESSSRQGKLATTLSLEEGRLWAHLTTDEPHDFTVETANAVAAVRDTHFSVRVSAGETFVSVAAGQLELTAQEQSVVVDAGQQAAVEPGRPPSPPEPMSEDEQEQWAAEAETVRIKELDLALPTAVPTNPPTPVPTNPPTAVPTDPPTPVPTNPPTPVPTDPPTAVPTDPPTPVPPTAIPTQKPTQPPAPTVTAPPTVVPGPPTIIAIDFPSEIPTDGTSFGGRVQFRDPDGDIDWAAFDVLRATDFTSFAFNPMESLEEGNENDGVFGFHMWCSTAQKVALRVTLYDAAGNSSAPVDFAFSCYE